MKRYEAWLDYGNPKLQRAVLAWLPPGPGEVLVWVVDAKGHMLRVDLAALTLIRRPPAEGWPEEAGR